MICDQGRNWGDMKERGLNFLVGGIKKNKVIGNPVNVLNSPKVLKLHNNMLTSIPII